MIAAVAAEFDTDAPGLCWDCGGPCLTFKGSVHGWRCRACVDRYLDDGLARWAARSANARERVQRNLFHNDNPTPVTANGDRRRDGGAPRYVPTAVPASIP